MFKANEQFGQFAAVNQAAIESLLTVANTSLATAERLAALNLNTARSFVADGASAVAALLAVKDVQGFVSLQQQFAKPAVEKAIAYSRSVYEIASESTNALGQIAEGQSIELKKTCSNAVE